MIHLILMVKLQKLVYTHPTDGLIPYDGVPVEEDVSVTLSVTVIFFILSSAGIVFAIVCLIFNFIFRNRKWAYNICNRNYHFN